MATAGIDTSPSQLADLIKSIGFEIGESIKMSSMQNKAPVPSPVVGPDQTQHISHSDQCTIVKNCHPSQEGSRLISTNIKITLHSCKVFTS